jgi:hypothetical protein
MQEHAVRCQSLAWPLFHKASQGRDGAAWKSSSRGLDSLSLDPLQTTLSFRRDLSAFRARYFHAVTANQTCVCCGVMPARRRLSRPGCMAACACSSSISDLASPCGLQVITGCYVSKRALYTCLRRPELFVRFLAHSSPKKRPTSPCMHPPPPQHFSILCSAA